MIITPNFSLEEIKSKTSAVITPEIYGKCRALCQYILQPIRDHFNKPLIITSMVRTPSENTSAGGHPDSHHLFKVDHSAVDFYVKNTFIAEVFLFVIHNLQFRYAIHYPDSNPAGKKSFIHVSSPDSSGIYNKHWIKQL